MSEADDLFDRIQQSRRTLFDEAVKAAAKPKPAPEPVANPLPQIRARQEGAVWWVRADDLADALDAAGKDVNSRLVAKLRRLR